MIDIPSASARFPHPPQHQQHRAERRTPAWPRHRLAQWRRRPPAGRTLHHPSQRRCHPPSFRAAATRSPALPAKVSAGQARSHYV